jgi:transcriptional regulator with XRE-family HTH domain
LPFCNLRLSSPRPPEVPRGYPHELRSLGDHIRRRRLDLGLRQRTVASRLGVSVETVALWEKGRVEPLPRQYPGLIRFLGYDPTGEVSSIGNRLQTLRWQLGLTQAEFAARLCLDEGTVSGWESGARRPSAWRWRRLEPVLVDLERTPREPSRSSEG